MKILGDSASITSSENHGRSKGGNKKTLKRSWEKMA